MARILYNLNNKLFGFSRLYFLSRNLEVAEKNARVSKGRPPPRASPVFVFKAFSDCCSRLCCIDRCDLFEIKSRWKPFPFSSLALVINLSRLFTTSVCPLYFFVHNKRECVKNNLKVSKGEMWTMKNSNRNKKILFKCLPTASRISKCTTKTRIRIFKRLTKPNRLKQRR